MSIKVIKTRLEFSDRDLRITEHEGITFNIIDIDTKKGGDIFEIDEVEKKDILPLLSIDKHLDVRNKISIYLGYSEHPPQFLHIYSEDSADFTIYGQAYPLEISKRSLGRIFNNRIGIIPLTLLVDPVITTLDNDFVRDLHILKNGPIYVLSLRDVISEIRNTQIVNEQNKKMIYTNFISVLFPRVSQDMFYDLIIDMDNNEFINKYKKYLQNQHELAKRYELEREIFTNTKEGELKLNKNVVSAKIKKTPVSNYNYNYRLIDIKGLFGLIEHKNLLVIRANTSFDDTTKRVLLTKINEDKKALALEVIQNNIFAESDTIQFILLVNDKNDYIKLMINERMILSVDFHLSIDTKYENYLPLINDFIKKINQIGRRIFNSDIRFEELVKNNIEYLMDIQITWHNSMSPNSFDKFIKEVYGTLYPDFLEMDKNNDKKFYFSKGIVTEIKTVNENFTTPSYYYDDEMYDKYRYLTKGKILEIEQDISNITFSLYNVIDSEYRIINRYIYWLAYTFSARSEKYDEPTKLVLKDLKTKDPNLYILKKFGSNIVYSRKCQKNYQPKAYDEIEYSELPPEIKSTATKYWNFTTHRDMYYVCPNKKYPYMSFITGVHPKGYCLPCCRKTNKHNVKIIEGGKKYTINEYCTKFHCFNLVKDDKQKSRYVIHFGKKINPSRLGKLPPLLDSLLNKSLIVENINEFSQKINIDNITYTIRYEQLNKLIELSKNESTKINMSYSDFKKMDWSLLSPIVTDNKVFDIDNFEHNMFFRDNYVTSIPVLYSYNNRDSIINPLGIINLFYITNSENIEIEVIDLRKNTDVFRHRFNYSQVAKSTKKNKEYIFKKTDKFKDLTENKYYLRGVQQQGTLKYTSFINSLAYIVGLDSEKMILHLLDKFSKMDATLSDIINYDKDFTDKTDFINSLMYAMKTDYISQNYDYSLVIRVLFEMTYRINIITIIYDNNKYSVENYSSMYELNAILLKKYDYTVMDIDNYITNTSDGKIFYYPIVMTSIKNFINNPNNIRKLFTNDIPFLQYLFTNIANKSTVLEFVRDTYNEYAIVEDKYRVYIKTSDGYYFYKFTKFNKNDLGIKFNIESIIVCLMKFREWIFAKSTINLRVDSADNTDNVNDYTDPLEKKYVPIHNINRITKIAVHNNLVFYVYLTNDNIIHRINPVNIETLNRLAKTYRFVFSDKLDVIKLNYHPDFINSVIEHHYIKDEITSKISENMTKVWDILDQNKDLYNQILEIIDIEFNKERRYKQILKVLTDTKFSDIPKKILSAAAFDFSLISKSEIFREKINMYNIKKYDFGKKYYYKLLS